MNAQSAHRQAAPGDTAAGADGPSPWGHAVREIARKEIVQHIKSMRVLIVSVLFAIAILLTTIVFPLAFMEPDAGRQNEVFGNFLGAGGISFLGGLFFIQLLAIILTADGVTSEWQRKTIFLVLSKPVSRTAFLMGKFVGAFVTVVVPFVVLMLVDYLLLIAVFEGGPSGEDWLRFLGALAVLVLGAGTFGAFGLFVSTLNRSSVGAFVLALTLWILVFPMLALPADILMGLDAEAAGGELDPTSCKYQCWRLLNPAFGMGAAADVIVEDNDSGFMAARTWPSEPWLGPVQLTAYMALFLGGAFLRIGRRDFE